MATGVTNRTIFTWITWTFVILCFANKAHTAPISPHCRQDQPTDQFIYSSEFKWGMSLDHMMKIYEDLYQSDKRLMERAYFSTELGQYVIPIAFGGPSTVVRLPAHFIASVQKHVEASLERELVDAIFFPDMGHSHYFVPEDFYKKTVSPHMEKYGMASGYEVMISHPETKILYHTAEQLNLRENDRVGSEDWQQFKYYHRNLVGDNHAQGKMDIHFARDNKYNTLHSLPGHFYWGAGFNISANQNGCFEFQFKGKKYYFDLSLKDIEPAPGMGAYGVQRE